MKLAVLIGIEYVDAARDGRMKRLHGCHDDVETMRGLLTTQFGFKSSEIVVLCDDDDDGGGGDGGDGDYDTTARPTTGDALRKVLLDAVAEASSQAAAADGFHLVVYFSGHGIRVIDKDGDEVDGMDEALCASDYFDAPLQDGMVTDDWLRVNVAEKMPAGSVLDAVFDCCHATSMLDMPVVGAKTRSTRRDAGSIKASIVCLNGAEAHEQSASTKGLQLTSPDTWGGVLTYAIAKACSESSAMRTMRSFVARVKYHVAQTGHSQTVTVSSSMHPAKVMARAPFGIGRQSR
jgi:hypothetical protein